MRLALCALAVALATLCAAARVSTAAGEPYPTEPGVRFQAIDVFVDSPEKLAAYQVELTYPAATVQVVGVEGGAADAYREAPHFDERGKTGGRIVLAAFTLDEDRAPEGRVRVARLHLRVRGPATPQITVRPVTAARPGGDKIDVDADVRPARRAEGEQATEA